MLSDGVPEFTTIYGDSPYPREPAGAYPIEFRYAGTNQLASPPLVVDLADGGMARIGDILQRMKSLSVQSSSGQLTDTERGYLNEEYTQLRTQVGDIANQTKFNGRGLINGAADKQIGADATQLASFGITAQLAVGQIRRYGT